MSVIIIAAMSENGVIGINNTIPWKIKEEMIHFKETTSGHPVIMGRKTYESIGRPLSNRTNIVVTRGSPFKEVISRHSLLTSIKTAQTYNTDVFIIGGSSIYEQALEMGLVDKMILSTVKGCYEGDAFFPMIDERYWKLDSEEDKGEFVVKFHSRR
jgi:dihydrofolate reductase